MWTERQRAMLQAMGLHLRLPGLEAAQPAQAEVAAGSSPQPAHRAAGGSGPTREHEGGSAIRGALASPLASPRASPRASPLTAREPGPTVDPAVASTGSRTKPPGQPASMAAQAETPATTGRAWQADAASAVSPSPARLVLPAAVASLDWPELRSAVAACRACSLCETRKQTVFGVGHPQARWMVVGEAPGAEEDARGEPFVGRAGQLLDAMLRALQLTRAADDELPGNPDGTPGHGPAQMPNERRVYIANTLKCRPPGNRNPQPEELARCEPFLVRQIELLRPRLILAMGRFAVQALLRSTEPIGKLRGRVHRYHGVPLVVSYHPAYLLRNPADKGKAWDDLCLAAEVAAQGAAADAPLPP